MNWSIFYKMLHLSWKADPIPDEWKKVEAQFAQNQAVIEFEENGAGSKKLTAERKISDIYRKSRTRPFFGKVIHQLAQANCCKNALELGTSLGMGTRYLALACEHVITIEGCSQTFKLAEQHFAAISLKNVELNLALFDNYLFDSKSFDLAYIDGNHQGKALLKYAEILLQKNPNCLIICDDIRWSKDMKKAFTKLKAYTDYSLDLYQIGIVSNQPIRF